MLRPDFVYDSLQHGKWLPEHNYEWTSAGHGGRGGALEAQESQQRGCATALQQSSKSRATSALHQLQQSSKSDMWPGAPSRCRYVGPPLECATSSSD